MSVDETGAVKKKKKKGQHCPSRTAGGKPGGSGRGGGGGGGQVGGSGRTGRQADRLVVLGLLGTLLPSLLSPSVRPANDAHHFSFFFPLINGSGGGGDRARMGRNPPVAGRILPPL